MTSIFRKSSLLGICLFPYQNTLINNTIKHAKAKKIDLSLTKDGDYLTIIYKDDGKGFDVSKVIDQPTGTGMGFSNIYSRINSLKGEIKIESEHKKGTFVTIKVMMHDE